MKLFFTKGVGAHQNVFTVKVGDEAAYPC
jgi:hypothetical protein